MTIMTGTASISIIAAPSGYWHGLLIALGLLFLIAVLLWFWNRRHFWLRLGIAMVVMFVGCVGVVAYTDYLLSDLRERLSGPVEELVATVEEEFPAQPVSRWQHELERLAGSIDGLPYLAVVSLEPDRGTVVAAYPSHLVGKTVGQGDLPGPATSTVIQKFIHAQLFKQVVFPAEVDPVDYRLTSLDEKPLQADGPQSGPGIRVDHVGALCPLRATGAVGTGKQHCLRVSPGFPYGLLGFGCSLGLSGCRTA